MTIMGGMVNCNTCSMGFDGSLNDIVRVQGARYKIG